MTGFAVVRIWRTVAGRASGDNYVVEWPYTVGDWHRIELVGPVRATLAEAKADAAESIPGRSG